MGAEPSRVSSFTCRKAKKIDHRKGVPMIVGFRRFQCVRRYRCADGQCFEEPRITLGNAAPTAWWLYQTSMRGKVHDLPWALVCPMCSDRQRGNGAA